MKTIELTQGYVALVDDEDFERVNAFKWYAQVNHKTVYAHRSTPRVNGNNASLYIVSKAAAPFLKQSCCSHCFILILALADIDSRLLTCSWNHGLVRSAFEKA